MKRNKVLLSAYSCEPGFSSERGVGWNWTKEIVKYHDVWVLTRAANRQTIEYELNRNPVNGLNFIYFDFPPWFRFWKKGERGLYLYYLLWQMVSIFVARRYHRKIKFDVTHYLTFGSVMLPHFIFLMPTKIILGPIGGGGQAPLSFLGQFSLKGKINEILRHSIQFIYKFNPLLHLAFKKADMILLRDQETLNMVPQKLWHKSMLFLETAVPPELLNYNINECKTQGLVIVVVGRFLHSKINVLTLKILQSFKNKYKKPFKVFIVGDGSERQRLDEFLDKNDIKENVEITGWLEREKVFEILTQSSIYMSTSFKEGGSWALFEAIMMELPVVCFGVGGPDVLIQDGCGIKIDVKNSKQVIEDFSSGLLQVAQSKILRISMAQNAKTHLLQNYTWDEMGQKMGKIYENILS
ncbi:MAG: hypothetical protein APR62_06450 [Smithella sp. SDB]|nr:MAG: hypothetical protein APR62_06450 [Smithella sp. SDB]